MILGTKRLGSTAQPRGSTTARSRREPGRVGRCLIIATLAGLLLGAVCPGPAHARSIRESSGYTGRHVHAAWAGRGVGLVAWTTSADFVSWTACGSSWASVEVDP